MMRFRIALALSSFALLAVALAPAGGCAPSVLTSTTSTGASTSSSSGGGSSTPVNSAPPSIPASTTCTVETIATGLSHPSQIIASGDAVYVVGDEYPTVGTITRVPLSGGLPVQVVTQTMQGNQWLAFSGLAADSSNLYWSLDDGSIYATSVNGTTTTLVPPITPAYIMYLGVVATDGAFLYVIRQQPNSIVRLPVDGGEPTKLIDGPSVSNISAAAIDATNIYWGNSEGGDGVIFKAPLTGGSPIQLARFHGSTGGFSTFDNAVFIANMGGWASVYGDGHLATGTGSAILLPTDPTQMPKTVVWGLEVPTALGVDATGVYWGVGSQQIAEQDPHFLKAPITRIAHNGLIENVAPATAMGGIVRCNGGICWTDLAEGTVLRAKCDPSPPVPTSPSTPSPACTSFCAAVEDCAGPPCEATCAALVAAPCETEGVALTTCLASHFDELSCDAIGCDVESQALAACRGAPSPALPVSAGGGPLGCGGFADTPLGQVIGDCYPSNGAFACTCYVNHTVVGTCSPSDCDAACCNALYNNALPQ